MKSRKKILVAAMALGLVWIGVCGSKCGGEEAAADPLKERAVEKYTEGRRLFLSCEPDNYRKAIQSYQDALSYWDDYPEALAGLAEAVSMYYGFNLPEEEFQRGYMSAQRSYRLQPELDMGYRALADLFRHRRNPETGELETTSALELINMALEKDPHSAENLYVKGSIYLYIDPDKARQILMEARQSNPNLGKVYFNLASANQILGEAALKKASQDSANAAQHQELAHKYFASAIGHLESYQTLVPGDLAGYCSQAIIYLSDGDQVKAEDLFHKTLTLNPNPDISQIRWRMLALVHLSHLAREKKDFENARFFLERGLDLGPMNVELLREVIDLLKESGDETDVPKFEDRLRQAIAEKQAMEGGAQPGPEGGAEPGPEGGAEPGPEGGP